ncbi:hypothetical protein CRYUN_Cryun19dG0049100 [Craigia yunnanensis]
MIWVEFKYKRIYKICKRYRIIGHTTPHCPNLNTDIERVINEQMEDINTHFGSILAMTYNTSFFQNNIRAFYNRHARRTIVIKFVNSYQSQ